MAISVHAPRIKKPASEGVGKLLIELLKCSQVVDGEINYELPPL